MPNAFQLISKKTGEAEHFVLIDVKMCAALDVPCDPEKYFMDWYDNIGQLVASGRKLEDMHGIYAELIVKYPDFGRLITWLMENYTTSSWAYVK